MGGGGHTREKDHQNVKSLIIFAHDCRSLDNLGQSRSQSLPVYSGNEIAFGTVRAAGAGKGSHSLSLYSGNEIGSHSITVKYFKNPQRPPFNTLES